MADDAGEILRRTFVQARLRFMLAGVCCVVFLAFLILLARSAGEDPLKPLRDVGFSAIGVCINFAVCLGAAALFGYWRRAPRAPSSADRKP